LYRLDHCPVSPPLPRAVPGFSPALLSGVAFLADRLEVPGNGSAALPHRPTVDLLRESSYAMPPQRGAGKHHGEGTVPGPIAAGACGDAARTDPCGDRPAIVVPAATAFYGFGRKCVCPLFNSPSGRRRGRVLRSWSPGDKGRCDLTG